MSKPTARELAEWDAKIEADFQSAVARTKAAGRTKRGRRHVGFPWAFLVDVCRLTEGRSTLAVAIYIYRRTQVCRSLTVTLPATELAEIGIVRQRKHVALAKLQDAKLIRIERTAGRTAKVTLTWQPG
jgi:hypothetical protein